MLGGNFLGGPTNRTCGGPHMESEQEPTILDAIKPGMRVQIDVPAGIGRHGQEFKPKWGKAVMRGPAGWVLNMGGAHGTPGIATEINIICVPALKYGKAKKS